MNDYCDNVYFIVKNKKVGSAIMRGLQMCKELSKIGVSANVLTHRQLNNCIDNSIFIWVKEISEKLILKSPNNFHIYDVVDAYLPNKNYVQDLLNRNVFNGLIVNNLYMKDEIEKTTEFLGKIFVLHHHWDPRLETAKKIDQSELKFGFFGSLASLNHTDNCLHYKQLMSEFSIQMYDCESGVYVENLGFTNRFFRPRRNLNAMNNLTINFNCHLSIRENDTDVSRYKTTAKIATASALGHNIITTNEKSVVDVMGEDYPFILKNSEYNTVTDMIDLVKEDYNSDKLLWNRGLAKMEQVKYKLSINSIANKYLELCQSLK
jgi:hypothetical protein